MCGCDVLGGLPSPVPGLVSGQREASKGGALTAPLATLPLSEGPKTVCWTRQGPSAQQGVPRNTN